MGYFKKDEICKTQEMLAKLADICLAQLMLSSDAYICMNKHNLHGYKMLHRHLSKKFQEFYLDVQKESIDKFGFVLDSEVHFKIYKPESLKEHLETWTEINEKHLKEVGEIIKSIFEEDGYICCIAQKIQKILYKNIIKNERAIQRFCDCNWSMSVIYSHDDFLHKKLKEEDK